MDRNIIAGDLKSFRHLEARSAINGREINIEHPATLIAMKVAMLVHVRTKPHRGGIKIDLLNEVASDEEIEAIIDRGH